MVSIPADASIGFQKEIKSKRRNTLQELESYFEDAPEVDGLRVRDTTIGVGRQAEAGDSVVVHFDCLYRGLDVASSREARLLGGNRTVSEPYEFVIGDTIEDVLERASLSGLSSGGGPKPPPALFLATQGMRTGGKRSILVPSQLGYGGQGYLEIPPDATFELQVELLDVR